MWMTRMDVQEQQHALGRLTRDAVWGEGDLQRVLERITKVASEILGVTRASIWLYEGERRDAIRCVSMWRGDAERHERGDLIHREDVPRYFAALEEDRIITANEAQEEPRTHELSTPYLRAHGIGALLDAPIVIEGKSVGVLCHEHVGASRVWQIEETLLAASIADIVALALESARTREVMAQLSARQEELHLALQAASMGAWCWDDTNDAMRWGDALGPLLGYWSGYEPGTLERHLEHVHAQDRDYVAAQFEALRSTDRGTTPFSIEYRAANSGGRSNPRWLRMTGRRVRVSAAQTPPWRGVIFDISAEKDVRDQLANAQRLDELGRLAGGVAHDFNNLLTIIRSSAAVISQRVDEVVKAALGAEVAIIEDAARRGAALTAQLLSFARRQRLDPQEVDVCKLVENAAAMLRRLIISEISLEIEVSTVPLIARIDPMQFEQVLVNVVVNAKDAMPSGGLIRVECGLEELREDTPELDGARICVRVTDQGEGMSPSVCAHAFEPFFTTKPPGRGTGLGLSTSYGIVHQAGGELVLRSEEGRGTAVSVYLPRVPRPTVDDGGATSVPAATPPRLGPVALSGLASGSVSGSVEAARSPLGVSQAPAQDPPSQIQHELRIMLVDDQEIVRRSIGQILRHAGYEIHEFGSGPAALRAFDILRPDLVITDFAMPGMTGRELADALALAHKTRLASEAAGPRAPPPVAEMEMFGFGQALPVILMSGFSSEPVETHEWERWLSKPFEPEDLQELISELAVLYGPGA